MKIDINWELDRILLKSGLIKEISCDQAVNVVHDLEKKLMQGYKIGLYGVGLEAEGLLHFIFSHVANFKIDCCFDKTIRSFKYKDKIRELNVHPIEDIVKVEVDYLILGSYDYRQVFLENLKVLNFKGKVIYRRSLCGL